MVWGLPHPTSPSSCRPPGPLRFRHMSGEVTPVKAGMSLGAGGLPPLSDQVADGCLRERLGGLLLSVFVSRERVFFPRLWPRVPDRWRLPRSSPEGGCYLSAACAACPVQLLSAALCWKWDADSSPGQAAWVRGPALPPPSCVALGERFTTLGLSSLLCKMSTVVVGPNS